MTLALFFLKHRAEDPAFDFIFSAVLLSVLAALTLWDRCHRSWQQSLARRWPKLEGKFDEGEIVTMKKGRSNTIAGYEVWLGYEYQAEGEQDGAYTRRFTTKEEAEAFLKLLADQTIFVRVARGNPKRSRVLDEDLSVLLKNQSIMN
jgi:hypothetical protein